MPVPTTRNEIDWNTYERLSEENPSAIVWASTGGNGCGKSAFGLTAPGPIFVCAFDAHGMNRVGKQFKLNLDGTKKDIRIARYPFSPRDVNGGKTEVSKAANTTWLRFVADYRMALRNCRTVLWDREDLMWELLRYASFGENSAAPAQYADLNMEYVSLIQEGFAASVNLGIMRGIRENWVSKWDPQKAKMVPHNTGEWIPDGMKKIPDHVDITLFHRWDDTLRSFVTKIDKFTNPEFKGQEFPNFSFIDMAMAAYPEKDPNEWGVQ